MSINPDAAHRTNSGAFGRPASCPSRELQAVNELSALVGQPTPNLSRERSEAILEVGLKLLKVAREPRGVLAGLGYHQTQRRPVNTIGLRFQTGSVACPSARIKIG